MGQSIWTPDHTMAPALGAASHVCAAAGAFTSDDPRQRRPDISKAKVVLGWEPKMQLRKELVRTIAYFDKMLSKGSIPGCALGRMK